MRSLARERLNKILLVIYMLFTFFSLSFGKTYEMYPTRNIHNQLQLNTKTGEVKQIQDDGQQWTICNGIEEYGKKEERFSLHETQNMWNFLLLDNYTGRVWQVQFSTEGEEYMFAFPINFIELAVPSKSSNWKDRFELHRTQNMWNFILLDSYTGRTWQLQYSTESLDNIMIVPIFDDALITSSNKKLSSRFKLHETQNMWTFILLDSYTGRLWQLQYTVDKDSIRGILIINEDELADENKKNIFYISPLTSMFQYYLTNDTTGEMWKFQWNTKGNDYRWIEKIK